MAGPTGKKRSVSSKLPRPNKKQRRIHQYNSDSDGEGGVGEDEFDAVNLLDSDDDIHNVNVDDVGDDEVNGSSSSDDDAPGRNKLIKKTKAKKSRKAEEIPEASSDKDEEEEEEEDDEDDEDDDSVMDDEFDLGLNEKKRKSKRNDPTAFATSLSKILATKLSSSKRSDPVLARSAAAHVASQAAVDNALESKAKRQLREQKRQALERGRVKDVLIATNNESGEPEVSTSEILETERKLRKVAQRGVVKLFNAVRAAQVKASEAERDTKKSGVIGMKHREEKVNELSKKGFLELIASGGGGLKKGALEEA